MRQRHARYQQIKRPHRVAFLSARLPQLRRPRPKIRRRLQHRKSLELPLQLPALLRRRMAENLKRNRFGQMSGRMQDMGRDKPFEFPVRPRPRKINPQTRVDQRRHLPLHARSPFSFARRSLACPASKVARSTPHSPEMNFCASISRRFVINASVTILRIAGPFFLSPVKKQISFNSESSNSTVIFILLFYMNPTFSSISPCFLKGSHSGDRLNPLYRLNSFKQ